jgi:DNA-binding Lrp family transcriptional regulator
MLAAERRDLLITRLRRDGKLASRDLAAEYGVSEDYVRRDLREMAAAGLPEVTGLITDAPADHPAVQQIRHRTSTSSRHDLGARLPRAVPGFAAAVPAAAGRLDYKQVARADRRRVTAAHRDDRAVGSLDPVLPARIS